jgi:flagellar motility protein MotE (MotC chaperone)
MKNNLIYITIFLTVFLLTTASLIILNENFNNIFRFDFREIQPPEDNIASLLSDKQIKNMKDAPDSVKFGVYKQLFSADSTVFLVQDSGIIDSLNKIKKLMAELQKSQSKFKQTQNIPQIRNNIAEEKKEIFETVNQDSVYQVWLKKTVKFYESMKPAEAAKIILGYSDDVAKDIVYKMKPKKAAKILASLDPKKVQNITRVE